MLIGLADEHDFPHEGCMDFVDNRFDPGTGTMIGRAVVPNPDLVLSPGLFARLRLAGSGTYSALLVPDEAIAERSGAEVRLRRRRREPCALPHRHDRPAARRAARRSARDSTPDDRVIVKGVQRVHADLPVDPEEAPSAEPPATQAAPATG